MNNNSTRFYATVTTFRNDIAKRQLRPMTSYLAGDTDTDRRRIVTLNNYIVVVQAFPSLDEAYQDIHSLRAGRSVYDKDIEMIIHTRQRPCQHETSVL